MNEKLKIETEWEKQLCVSSFEGKSKGEAIADFVLGKAQIDEEIPIRKAAITVRLLLEDIAWVDVFAKRMNMSRSAIGAEIFKAGLGSVLSSMSKEERVDLLETDWIEIYNAIDKEAI